MNEPEPVTILNHVNLIAKIGGLLVLMAYIPIAVKMLGDLVHVLIVQPIKSIKVNCRAEAIDLGDD